jgi:hypothetical protein
MMSVIKKHKNLIPILFLAMISLYTVINVLFYSYTMDGVTYNYNFSIQNFPAFFAVVINIMSYFLFRAYFRYFVLVTIILGIFGLLSYTIYNTSINSIPFQFTSLMTGLLYIILNYDRFKKRLGIPADKEMEDASNPQQIESFKKKFGNKADHQLEDILSDARFINDARTAAKEILKERADK